MFISFELLQHFQHFATCGRSPQVTLGEEVVHEHAFAGAEVAADHRGPELLEEGFHSVDLAPYCFIWIFLTLKLVKLHVILKILF